MNILEISRKDTMPCFGEIITIHFRLITCGQDGVMKIWNYNNGHCLNTLVTGL